jgi:hypothetical protein
MTRRPSLRALLVLASALGPGLVAATNVDDFARCLSRAGATYYTAAWCPHCAHQNQMFGAALRYLRAVDCTDGCDGVSAFPTWRFKDGSRLSGVASFDVLAQRTGCRLGASRDERDGEVDVTPSSAGSDARERYVGGAKIIEVPRR